MNITELKQQTTAQAMVYEDLLRKYESLAKREAAMRDALEKLARLGNEPNYGNSVGNDIAIKALSPDAGRDYVSRERVMEAIKAAYSCGDLGALSLTGITERINAL